MIENRSRFGEGCERDNPFAINSHDKCRGNENGPCNNEYNNGFIAGCLSIEGNPVEICENSTEADFE